jgi:hypothetical protein
MTVSRRDALVGLGAAGAALLPGQAGASIGQNEWAPTELGRKLMSLLPAHVATIYDDANHETHNTARKAKRSEARLEAAARAIAERPIKIPSHLTDCAIVWAAYQDCTHRTWTALDDVLDQMAITILKWGGVAESECNINLMYATHKQQREAAA